MDINQLLKGVRCACGKKHTCDIKYVFIEDNAILRLSEICEAYNNILLVADQNTFAAAGKQTEAALKNKSIEKVIFSGETVLVPNESAINAVKDKLEGIDLIIGIGSGVIQDLCKYVAFYNKIPYMIVATAPSMDGYASNGAAMITDGMKVTYSAGLPIALVADTEVIRNAPIEMLKAGYGDIIGKFSALNDWKLSHCINNEYFCQYIYNLTYEQIIKTVKLASGILSREKESVKALMDALIIVGILMSFAGSSRPASGSEHHLAHYFEITGIIEDTQYFPHGIDVAYSTVVTAALREKILANPFPKETLKRDMAEYICNMQRVYKSVADGCIALQERVGFYNIDRSEIYIQKEKEIRSILAEMPTADKIKELLGLVGLNIDEFYTLYGSEKIEDAVIYAKDLKDRFSVLWMNYDYRNAKPN